MTYTDIAKMTETQLVSIILGDRLPTATSIRLAEMITSDTGLDHSVLAAEPGVGPMTIARLEAATELGKRITTNRAQRQVTSINRPEEVVELMTPRFAGASREHFWAIILNTKNRIIKTTEISVGSLNASIVHPRELFKEAVKVSAASVIVTHNHPSGDPTPSGADIQLTRRLAKAGDVLGIELIDHVVIGDTFTSLREEGLM